MAHNNYHKEQVQNVRGTNEEVDAWEALRREPGLMGRLARRGKHMKRDFVGGRRSFKAKGGSEDGRIDDTHQVIAVTDIEAKALNYLKNQDKKQGHPTGSGPRLKAMAAKDDQPFEYMMYKGMKIPSLNDFGMDEGSVETGGRADRGGGSSTDRDNSNDPSPSPSPTPAPGDGGGETAEQRKARLAREAAAAEAKAEKAAAEKKKADEKEAEGTERKERRAGLAEEYGGYKDEFGDLKGQADYQDTRDDLSGYQGQADTMAAEAGTKFGGYESQISQMPDRGGEVAGIGGQVGTAAGKMGTMAADATDTSKLMEDRGLFAGQIEAKRKAGEKGKMANLRRSMASAGSSPEEIARAEAEASSGGGQAGREDALAASMGAMGAKQSQMSQAAGMLQGQAGMYGQQAGMLGQAQNLGLQKTQAQAGMYGQGLQAQTGLMNTGASLANQQQMSMQNQIQQQQGLIGSQAGMTDAQMQNVVAQQNSAQELDLAERGLTATANANAANKPKGPSQSEQLMGLVKTGASVKIAMMCIPEGTKIDTPDGGVSIEEIKAGDFVIGMDGKDDEVLQVHQYKEDPEPVRFATVTFDDGSTVDCCDKHRISGKRTEDYRPQDKVGSRKVTDIDWYNGVSRSYDLLTATGGYRINGVPVNTMIPEMAEMITELNKNIKLAA